MLLTMATVVESDAGELVHARDWRQEVHIGLGYDAPSLGDYSVNIVSNLVSCWLETLESFDQS